MTTRYDPNKHHRRSIRLREFDYSWEGAYFVTVCTQNRSCLFGDVVEGKMRLNEAGNMVAAVWDSLSTRFPAIDLDAFVVMPNHIHAIIILTNGETPPATVLPNRETSDVGAPLVGAPRTGGVPRPAADATKTKATTTVAPTSSLGVVVGAYKSLTTVEFACGVKTLGWPPFAGKLWQRNYFEHIIRDEAALQRCRAYIMENPARWSEDVENPARLSRNPNRVEGGGGSP